MTHYLLQGAVVLLVVAGRAHSELLPDWMDEAKSD